MLPVAEAVGPWHDLFSLIGTASATLVGLLFVAASVGSGHYTQDNHPALRVFLSPSVFHFTCVLVACLIVVAPLRSWPLFGALIGADGLVGVAYTSLVWRNLIRHGFTVDLEDRLWYAAVPVLCYAVLTAAAVMLLRGAAFGCEILAFAIGVLLLIGIRNAWDMTLFTILRRRE
jgi:hypothetical protein